MNLASIKKRLCVLLNSTIMIPLRSQQRIAMSQAVRVVILNRSRIVMKWDGRQWWNVEVSPSDEPSGIKPAAVA